MRQEDYQRLKQAIAQYFVAAPGRRKQCQEKVESVLADIDRQIARRQIDKT